MKLATWNVNSIRARLPRVMPWLLTQRPDVLCMQELKVEEKDFPRDDFEAVGYHVAMTCQKSYNGVGIVSRFPVTDVSCGMGDEEDAGDGQARLIAGTIRGVRVLSAYFPNGQKVGSDKYAYKLRWMERLRAHLERNYDPAQPLVLCGDFNVAPEERDVYDPYGWDRTTLFHADVRNALARIEGWGFVDAFRLHHPEGGAYSWWDYRMLAFVRNKGLRIDHVYVTRPLVERCTAASIDKEVRKEFKNQGVPSDHAPVMIELRDEAGAEPPAPPAPGQPAEPGRGGQGSLF